MLLDSGRSRFTRFECGGADNRPATPRGAPEHAGGLFGTDLCDTFYIWSGGRWRESEFP